jgi:hypothetical protein
VFLGFGGGLLHLVVIAREETRRLKSEPKRATNGSKPAADDEVTKDTGTG